MRTLHVHVASPCMYVYTETHILMTYRFPTIGITATITSIPLPPPTHTHHSLHQFNIDTPRCPSIAHVMVHTPIVTVTSSPPWMAKTGQGCPMGSQSLPLPHTSDWHIRTQAFTHTKYNAIVLRLRTYLVPSKHVRVWGAKREFWIWVTGPGRIKRIL